MARHASLRILGVVFLALPASVHAGGTITTGVLPIFNQSGIKCVAVNVGKKPVDLAVQITASVGGLTAGSSCMAVQPGGVCGDGNTPFSSGSGVANCVVTTSGSRNSVRGTLSVLDTGLTTVVATSDAR